MVGLKRCRIWIRVWDDGNSIWMKNRMGGEFGMIRVDVESGRGYICYWMEWSEVQVKCPANTYTAVITVLDCCYLWQMGKTHLALIKPEPRHGTTWANWIDGHSELRHFSYFIWGTGFLDLQICAWTLEMMPPTRWSDCMVQINGFSYTFAELGKGNGSQMMLRASIQTEISNLFNLFYSCSTV